MCGFLTTSTIALADSHLYGGQFRLHSIAAKRGCCRGDDALLCGPETTSSILLADCVHVEAHAALKGACKCTYSCAGMCGSIAALLSCRGVDALLCRHVTTSFELPRNSLRLVDCMYQVTRVNNTYKVGTIPLC